MKSQDQGKADAHRRIEPKRVLVVRLDHIGDCVLTVPPVVKAVKESHPDASIDVLTTSSAETLLCDDPNINRVIAFDPPWTTVSKRKSRGKRALSYVYGTAKFACRTWPRGWRRYDIVIYLSFSPWDRFLTMPLGKKRVGFIGPYYSRGHKLASTCLTRRIRFDETRHMVRNCLDLVDSVLALRSRVAVNRLYLRAERKVRGAQRIREIGFEPSRVIALHPSNEGSMKSWPMPRPLELARLLASESGMQVLFVLSPGHYQAMAEMIEDSERQMRNIGHVVTASFEELAEVFANVALVVANDGGPMHIAAGLGVPTLALFGPTDERLYGPLSPSARVIRSDNPCGARHKPWRVECRCGNKACLRDLKPETVAEAVRTMLANQGHG